MSDDRERWRTPRYVASVWHCGDEYCNCSEPRIDLVTPGSRYPFVKREPVWSGTFRTDSEGSEAEWRAELEPEAEKYGISLDDDLYGERPVGAQRREP